MEKENGNYDKENMITIKNLRCEKIINPWQVRVDRAHTLGNPYIMREEKDRDKVCEKYKTYFYQYIENEPTFIKAIDKLIEIYETYGKLELFCWCHPKRCHAETIRDYILKRTEKAINIKD